LAKGLTSGYQPLGASVVSDKVWGTICDGLPDRMPFSHGFTYMGHPAACAAALANLEIIDEERLVENAADVGEYLLSRLEELESFETVGEVRGLGLMAGIEFVSDATTSRGFLNPHQACELVEHEAWARGLYCRAMGLEVVGLAPPLTIDRETVDRMVEILGDSIEAMESALMPAERERASRPTVSVSGPAEFFGEVLPEKIDREAAKGFELSVLFVLEGEGGGSWLLEIVDGSIEIGPAPDDSKKPLVTVRASAEDFTKIVNGELSGADAFISQQLAVEGDLDAAASLLTLGVL
jgi:putative sterol carrier protein